MEDVALVTTSATITVDMEYVTKEKKLKERTLLKTKMSYKYKFTGDPKNPILTIGGTAIAKHFTRIVLGGRGAYVEFIMLDHNKLYIPEDATWRVGSRNAYYIEYRVNDFSNAKVYYQLRSAEYADYRRHFYYISPVYLLNFERDGKYDHKVSCKVIDCNVIGRNVIDCNDGNI